jgi:hypothetical protein
MHTVHDEVLKIISDDTGIPLDSLFLPTRLEQDYGVIGDDIWSVLELMQSKFNIDFSELEFDIYFTPECEGFFTSLFNRRKVKHRNRFPVTVGHLIHVAQKGKWFKPEQVKI